MDVTYRIDSENLIIGWRETGAINDCGTIIIGAIYVYDKTKYAVLEEGCKYAARLIIKKYKRGGVTKKFLVTCGKGSPTHKVAKYFPNKKIIRTDGAHGNHPNNFFYIVSQVDSKTRTYKNVHGEGTVSWNQWERNWKTGTYNKEVKSSSIVITKGVI